MSLVMNYVIRRIVILFQFVVSIFRRALCCFKRRRKSFCDAELINVRVISNGQVGESSSWDSWEEPKTQEVESYPDNSVEEQIRLYRQQRAKLQEENTEENEAPVDYFQEMAPKIIRQTKILLKDKTEIQESSNFSLAPDPVFRSSELGVWEESQTWEAQADESIDVNDVLREQKKQDREKKFIEQQRRKGNRQTIATKGS